MQRPSSEEYFMSFAKLAAKRSTCLRRSVGAVAIKNNHILCSGYNGAPAGAKHCDEVGCLRESLRVPSGERHEICRGVHAEQNLIVQAAYHGVSIRGATVYCTHQPCSICAKMLVNAGVTWVFYLEGYPDYATEDIIGDRLTKISSATRGDIHAKNIKINKATRVRIEM